VSAYLATGLMMTKRDDGEDADVRWFINPYVSVIAGGKFFAGVRVDNGRAYGDDYQSDTKIINWSVPLGIHFAF
jgi:hypothetical protein